MARGVNPSSRRTRQRGLSLVEIMVALLLGAIITVGIINMFTANRATYQVNMGQARLQENGRFAMDFVTASMRNAGYTGCSSRVAEINNVVIPAAGNNDSPPAAAFDLRDAISGHRKLSATDWEPDLVGLPASIPVADIPVGSDMLILRYATGDDIDYFADTAPPAATSFSALPPGCGPQNTDPCPGFEPGDVLVASDCQAAVVFMVTSRTPQANTTPPSLRIGHSTSTVGGFKNAAKPFMVVGELSDDASILALRSEIYFIAPSTDADPDTGLPRALWRSTGGATPVELVEGIENMTVLYGEDTSGDRTPNIYRTIDDVGNRENVVTLRVTLRANSVNRVTDQGDGLLRRDFTKTVAIRNRI
ncbi:MAG: PilW family protein [Gammaproteobacteria bacterium]|nr:PilW family protein [Gammaproteobacteria bacterium]